MTRPYLETLPVTTVPAPEGYAVRDIEVPNLGADAVYEPVGTRKQATPLRLHVYLPGDRDPLWLYRISAGEYVIELSRDAQAPALEQRLGRVAKTFEERSRENSGLRERLLAARCREVRNSRDEVVGYSLPWGPAGSRPERAVEDVEEAEPIRESEEEAR